MPSTEGTNPKSKNWFRPAVRAGKSEEKVMKTSVPLAIVLIGSFAVPAFAANYYVVRNNATKACSVMERTPASSKETVLGYPTFYQNKANADQAMKNAKECNS
jgi:vancomycin permeability regulator SanA